MSEDMGALIFLGEPFSALAFTVNVSAAIGVFSGLSDDKFVTAVNAFFKVILAKARAGPVRGMTVENSGFAAEEKSHDT